jgi:hypothetical protein
VVVNGSLTIEQTPLPVKGGLDCGALRRLFER